MTDYVLEEKKIELIKDVVAWHTRTFQNTTEQEQMQKLREEYNEYMEAKEVHCLKKYAQEEKADVIIVLIVLAYRYDNFVAKLALNNRFNKKMIYEVEKKMEINRNRKWKGNHHIEVLK